jgi:hypothetical protein
MPRRERFHTRHSGYVARRSLRIGFGGSALRVAPQASVVDFSPTGEDVYNIPKGVIPSG